MIDGEGLPFSEGSYFSDGVLPPIPSFQFTDEFKKRGGECVEIRELDEPDRVIPGRDIKMDDGTLYKGPDSIMKGYKPEFVRYLRHMYKKKATGILKYLMEKVNEYNQASGGTGYSRPVVFIDKASGQEMSPEQKLAFVLKHNGCEGTMIDEMLESGAKQIDEDVDE
jgi:hypothetical protein